eukprot:4710037-Amphidinium_carterae.1
MHPWYQTILHRMRLPIFPLAVISLVNDIFTVDGIKHALAGMSAHSSPGPRGVIYLPASIFEQCRSSSLRRGFPQHLPWC